MFAAMAGSSEIFVFKDALIVLGTLFGTHLQGGVQISMDGSQTDYFFKLATDVAAQQKIFAIWTAALVLPILIAALFVCFGYLVDCLYAERKDRSILFWRSLPVSDRDTVLAKFFVATIATPLLVWAVALVAAARDDRIHAVVSRGGRPDLAAGWLDRVTAPTLLIVGGEDFEVLELNRRALDQLHGPKELAVVAGATHLFEEPGTLQEAAERAARWFQRHLPSGASS